MMFSHLRIFRLQISFEIMFHYNSLADDHYLIVVIIFSGNLRERVQERLRGRRHLVRASLDRRHGRPSPQVERRLRLGLQELRRRRSVGHRRSGLRISRPHVICPGNP
jgi:hypothetical protein